MGTSALASLERDEPGKADNSLSHEGRAGRSWKQADLTSDCSAAHFLELGGRTRSSLPGMSLQAGASGGPRHALYNTNTRGHLSCGVCSDVNRLPKKSELPHPNLADVKGLTQQSCST